MGVDVIRYVLNKEKIDAEYSLSVRTTIHLFMQRPLLADIHSSR